MRDERFSKNKQKYFTLDYDNLTERGLRDLIKAFSIAGADIVEVVASDRAKRVNGEEQKTVQLIFDNGQSVTVVVGPLGDIAQTKLNSSIAPISQAKSAADYARDVVTAMERNQDKFDKALARKAASAIKDTSDVKPASRSLAARIKEAGEAVAAASNNLAAERKRLAVANVRVNETSSELDKLKSQLSALKSEENSLIEAITAKGGKV